MSLTFKAAGSRAVPFDFPVRWSGFLERGRPRPLNPSLMQTRTVLVFGLKAVQDPSQILDRDATGIALLLDQLSISEQTR